MPADRVLCIPAAVGFQDAQLAVGVGEAGLVAEPLIDGQGLLVVPGGLVVVPAGPGEDPELVYPGGAAR